MKPYTEKSIQSLLNASGGSFQSLLQQLEEIQQVNTALASALAPQLAEQCQAGKIKRGILSLQVKTTSAATQLTYQRLSLLTHLRQHGFPGLAQIKVRVMPTSATPSSIQSQQQPSLTLSNAAAKEILNTAQSLPEGRLRQAWEKIAAHGLKRKAE